MEAVVLMSGTGHCHTFFPDVYGQSSGQHNPQAVSQYGINQQEMGEGNELGEVGSAAPSWAIAAPRQQPGEVRPPTGQQPSRLTSPGFPSPGFNRPGSNMRVGTGWEAMSEPYDLQPLHHKEALSCVVVVTPEGVPIGVFTERDVVRLVSEQRDLMQPIRAVMSQPLVTLPIDEFTDLFQAIELFQRHNVRHMPLVDAAGKLVGLLTHASLRQLTTPLDLLKLRMVSEVMTAAVVTTGAETLISVLAQMMTDKQVSSVVITQVMPPQAIVNSPVNSSVNTAVDRWADRTNAQPDFPDLPDLPNSPNSPNSSDFPNLSDLPNSPNLKNSPDLPDLIEQPIGIITERDLVQFQALQLDDRAYCAGDIMSTPVFTVDQNTSLLEVQRLMDQQLIRRVVVTNDWGELCGIVTQTSLFNSLNPIELYNLATMLETRVKQLEQERARLLSQHQEEVRQQVQKQTFSLKARMSYQQVLLTIATQIRSSLSLQHILDTTVKLIREHLDCDRVSIWRFDDQWCSTAVAEAIKPGVSSLVTLLGDQIYDECFPGNLSAVYYAGQVQVVQDIYAEEMSDCHRSMLERLQTRSKILVPISTDDRLWGLLNATESETARDWQPEDVSLLQELSLQIAIAIQQATAYDQLQTELKERKQVEAQLREAQAQLADLNQSLEQRVEDRTAELREREKQLQRLMNRLSLAARAGQLGIWEWDIPNNQVVWDERTFQIYGLEGEQAQNPVNYEFWLSCLHPDDRERCHEQLNAVLQSTSPYEVEFQVMRPDGDIRFVQSHMVVLQDEQGEPQQLIGLNIDITDSKRIQLKLEQQAKQERLMNTISQRIRSSLELDQVLQTTVDTMQTGLNADRVLVYRIFVDGTGMAIAEAVAPGWDAVLNRKFPAEVFPAEGYERYIKGNVFRMRDRLTTALPPCLVQFLEDLQVRSKLVVPIIQYETLWGLLIAHQCSAPRTWTEDEVELLRQIASQVSIAIQQSDLYQHLQLELIERQQTTQLIRRQAKRERLLREISQRIRESFDLHTIFERATHEIRLFLEADRVAIFQFESELNLNDGRFMAESRIPDVSSVLDAAVHDHCFGEHYAPLYQLGQFQATANVHSAGLKNCHLEVLERFEVQANLVMPLLRNENLWGLLCVHQCTSSREWQINEIEFVQQIANQLTIAIQQASLIQQLQRELADRVETEQRLQQANAELERATRLKDEFLANMSHELRTPLNAILGMTEGLQEEIFGKVNDSQRKSLQTIERSGSHLLELINDILDLAKIEAGQIELDRRSTSVNALCQTSLVFIKQQAFKKRIHLNLDLPANLPQLEVDERRIRQVLINLLNNAVKFTPESGTITLSSRLVEFAKIDLESLRINPKKRASLQTESLWLKVSITDTGIGIESENLKRLFKPFIQIDSALNRQFSGTGLGLSLVKRIIELHQGFVFVKSVVGEGSEFGFILPCTNAVCLLPQKPDESTQPQAILSPGRQTAVILLVEDNEANIQTMTSYLEALGYTIHVAKNGQSAIELLPVVRPDLILMDVQMPGMDGLETTTAIRRMPDFAALPIITLTALAMSSDRDRCMEAGATDYLAKPVKLRQLAQLIQSYLRSLP